MAGDDEELDLGPWRDANLRVTATAASGAGADAGVPPEIRFRSSVAKLLRRRLAIMDGKSDNKDPVVFLLRPSPPDETASFMPKRVPCLDNGMHPLNGRVWFVGAGPGSGHYIMTNADDDDELFKFVTDELQEGETPAILYDPRHPDDHMRYYPAGLSATDNFQEIPLATTEVTIEAVSAAIESTYAEKMITPDAQPKSGKLWFDRYKRWPVSDAEDRVQMYLEIALNAAFPTCTVRPEQTMPEGRLDVEIIENDAVDRSKITQHGILELKVLRSFRESGARVSHKDTKEWIHSGVEQAAAYRDSKGAKWGALVCFDMRLDDVGEAVCFKHVRSLAKSLEVHLRRWFIFATSKQRRSALAAART